MGQIEVVNINDRNESKYKNNQQINELEKPIKRHIVRLNF